MVLEILRAIPAALNLLREVKGIFRYIQELTGDPPHKFIADMAEVVKEYKLAKTGEEQVESLKKFQKLLKRV